MGADILSGRNEGEGKESFIVGRRAGGGRVERWFLLWTGTCKAQIVADTVLF